MSKKSPLAAAAAPAVYFCNNRRCDSILLSLHHFEPTSRKITRGLDPLKCKMALFHNAPCPRQSDGVGDGSGGIGVQAAGAGEAAGVNCGGDGCAGMMASDLQSMLHLNF
jgi:hypothetical protein